MRLPRVDPIIPVLKAEIFDDRAYSYEVKYDGFRGLLHICGNEKYLRSRKRLDLRRFDRLAKKLAGELGLESVIMDGEIISKDETGRPVFDRLMKTAVGSSYVAFDVLFVNGHDLRNLPLSTRRNILRELVPKRSHIIELPVAVRTKGSVMYSHVCRIDLEGVVAKRLSDTYRETTLWYKILNPSYSQSVGRAELFAGFRRAAQAPQRKKTAAR